MAQLTWIAVKAVLTAFVASWLVGCAAIPPPAPSPALAALNALPREACKFVDVKPGDDLAVALAQTRAAQGACIRRVDGYKRFETIIRKAG